MSNPTDVPALSNQQLGIISSDFVKVADKLKEASYTFRKQGGYEYPVFIMTKETVSIGALLIDREEPDNKWRYYAAYLELLVKANLVAPDKVDEFKTHYKDPDEFCCLLVIDGVLMHFVYIPYPESS